MMGERNDENAVVLRSVLKGEGKAFTSSLLVSATALVPAFGKASARLAVFSTAVANRIPKPDLASS
jgi:hypothetical protein